MTEPMTPPDCDLRDFAFMPLEVRRLLTSETWVLGNAEEKVAALMLWMESWHQVPAASLPDNDRMLAHLSGAGARWPKVAAHALRGWVKCSDGRLYHAVVAEKARDAFSKKEKQRERSRKANAARWGAHSPGDAQGEHKEQEGEPDGVLGASHKDAASIPQGVQQASRNDPKGQGEGEGEGRDRKEPPSPPSVVRSPRGSRLPDGWQPDEVDRAFAANLALDPAAVADQFRDFWLAKAGKDAAKLDWPATWRNWCRREAARPTAQRRAQPAGKLDWLWAEMRAEAEASPEIPAARMIQ